MSASNSEPSPIHEKSLSERRTRTSTDLVGPTDRDASIADRPTRMEAPFRSIEAVPPSAEGRYVEPVEIGRGGMGVVWKVRDVGLDRWVAIKRVLPNLDNYDAIVARFLAEAKSLAKVTHPNIVGIFDHAQDEFGPYIVMEYVEGVNLLELIKQKNVIPVEDAVRLVRKVCAGLHEAHRAGIIHRDIKPSNILIDKSGRAKLTDFGLARLGGSQGHSLSGQVLGTEGYMSPEQYENPKNATAASDQYSLAATLYHMVTGRSPRMIHLRHVPDVLQDILARALDEHADNRFSSIAAFHDAFGPIRKNNSVPTSAAQAKVSADESTEGDSNLANLFAELRKKAEANLRLARKCFEEYKDAEAIQILNRVPEELRDKAFEQQVKTRLEKGAQLEKEISLRVREMRVGELPPLLDQFVLLYPNRSDMRSLREQLSGGGTTASTVAGDYSLNEYPKPSALKAGPAPRPSTQVKVPPPQLPRLLVAPFDAATARAGQEAWAKHLGCPVELTNSISMKFRLIPPGQFLMGSVHDENFKHDETPQHKVCITKPFYFGIYPVTQGEFKSITDRNPSFYRSLFKTTSSLPVESVSWKDAQSFLQAMSDMENGRRYRLPTEAEWEYVCRAGTTTQFWFGDKFDTSRASMSTWFQYLLRLGRPVPVGGYEANPFGIYDTHGNIREWCQDEYSSHYYRQFTDKTAVDPSGPASDPQSTWLMHVTRGGAWIDLDAWCRSAYRNQCVFRSNRVGFRAVCELPLFESSGRPGSRSL